MVAAGGLIAKQRAHGMRVVVATLVTADPIGQVLSPFAQRFHAAWGGVQRPFAVRCIEDATAVGALDAEWRHYGLLDCIYRQAASGRYFYDTLERLFSGLQDPEDTAQSAAISDIVSTMIDELRPTTIYTAATVGRHVDHVCVLSAVVPVARRRGAPLVLWEDQPYVTGIYPRDNPDTIVAALTRIGQPGAVPVTEEIDIAKKLAALRHYVSQIKELYGSLEDMDRTITDYAINLGRPTPSERFWTVRG
jgi:LmbE family N-acetylglucosaminyl deacetylase